MSGIDVNIPKAGWQIRWIKQAAALLLRHPLPSAFFFAAISANGFLTSLLLGLFPSLMGSVLVCAMTTAFGALICVYFMSLLLKTEGYAVVERSDIIGPAKQIAAASFVISSIYMTAAAVVVVWRISNDLLPDSNLAAPQDPSIAMLALGQHSILSSIVAFMCINPFWPALIPSLGVNLSGSTHLNMRFMGRARSIWLAVFFVILVTALSSLALPFLISVALTTLLLAWLYVAAREIFGGISSNQDLSFNLEPMKA